MRRPVLWFLIACAAFVARAVPATAGTISIGAGQTFTTLAAGYAAAVDGDTLLIFDGIYAGGLTVNKLLTFQAVNIGGAIVDGGGSGVGFTVGRDSTYIGLTVRNADSAYFQRDNHAHGVIMRSVIEDVINGVEINDTGGTAGSFDVFQSTFNSFGTAVYINDGGTINITNSILANGGTAYLAADFLAINPDHNLLFNVGIVAVVGPGGHVGTIGSDPAQIIGNPLFVNAAAGDFRLMAGSPAIDSGKDIGLTFQSGAPDRGAFEAAAVPEPATLTLLSLGALVSFGQRWRRKVKTH